MFNVMRFYLLTYLLKYNAFIVMHQKLPSICIFSYIRNNCKIMLHAVIYGNGLKLVCRLTSNKKLVRSAIAHPLKSEFRRPLQRFLSVRELLYSTWFCRNIEMPSYRPYYLSVCLSCCMIGLVARLTDCDLPFWGLTLIYSLCCFR